MSPGGLSKLTTNSGQPGLVSPFQPEKENWKAVTFLNCSCISPESPGRRLIEEIKFSFRLERACSPISVWTWWPAEVWGWPCRLP
jgi:hypothetical protein